MRKGADSAGVTSLLEVTTMGALSGLPGSRDTLVGSALLFIIPTLQMRKRKLSQVWGERGSRTKGPGDRLEESLGDGRESKATSSSRNRTGKV